LEFVRLALPLLRVSGGIPFDRNIRPSFRVVSVELEPLLSARFGIRLDRLDRTFRLAHAAIDAFVRMDDEHVLTLVEAIDGADLHAIHQFALDATLVDNVGQLIVLPADRLLIIHVDVPLALWLKMNAEKTRVFWLDRNAEQCAFTC
jgi:hypothetical protein